MSTHHYQAPHPLTFLTNYMFPVTQTPSSANLIYTLQNQVSPTPSFYCVGKNKSINKKIRQLRCYS